ncbi:hypothetical protein WMY93_021038 [Mugilogobius chulae]|uniref:BTB domain-containing protein n=1 Tax=Mugilogobius chulae TaxID=88201 RepID=A0AAW0NLT4_9GOBI
MKSTELRVTVHSQQQQQAEAEEESLECCESGTRRSLAGFTCGYAPRSKRHFRQVVVLPPVKMGSLGSKFQSPSPGPEEVLEGISSSVHKHSCDYTPRSLDIFQHVSGSWKESNMMEINLEIPDQNIDTEALQVVFGSLYRDDVLIKPSRVVSILAAACMLQLDGLIQQCGETMKENISRRRVQLLRLCQYIWLGFSYEKWMFLQLNSSWDGPIKQLLADADGWLCKRRTDWLTTVYKNQWFAMLRTEFDNDNGPQEANKDEFELRSMRCGRKLTKEGDYCWRWTGFNFGFDLLVTYTNRFIVFKRNTLSQPCGGAVSLQPRRHLAFRLRLASFDNRGKLVCSRSTGYQLLTLEKDQEYVVMNLDSRLLSFPLYVCCNFLYTSSHSDQRPDSPEEDSSSSRSVS